ncbi:MAG: hypothetical protein V1661_01790 [bacterium]
MRNKEREAAAEAAAKYVKDSLDPKLNFLLPEVGIILGTGWGDTLLDKCKDYFAAFPLETLPGFEHLKEMPKIEGHDRELWLTTVNNKAVAMLRGRIHMNETHSGEELARMVRLQVEMLIKLGVKHLILTNAAGSLHPDIKVGDLVAHDGFIMVCAPPLPLWGGEFNSAEDVLKRINIQRTKRSARRAGLVCHEGAGVMVRGPGFEGRKYDKKILSGFGASMAMMSILPEATVAALYPEVNVCAISFITNTASEEHSHAENQKRASESAGKLGDLLLNLIESLPH